MIELNSQPSRPLKETLQLVTLGFLRTLLMPIPLLAELAISVAKSRLVEAPISKDQASRRQKLKSFLF